jgi:hypothetical protein
MNKKVVIPIIAIIIIGALVVSILFILLLNQNIPLVISGERKAIIVGSANDFYAYEAEDDFNSGDWSNFSSDSGRWVWENSSKIYGGPENLLGKDGQPGVLHLVANTVPNPTGYVNLSLTYNWTVYHSLYEFAYYNLSAWVNIPSSVSSPGARVGLRWSNSIEVVRTDWSNGIQTTTGQWTQISVAGLCNNATNNLITQLHLVLAVEGTMTHNEDIFFDDVKVDRWISVNLTNPTDPSPPPSRIDSDGFPAQALHVYYILKDHGYTDDNIFLMLYHTNDAVIDITAGDLIANDLTNAIIDVENDDVNASRFKRELNVSITNSFASDLNPKDQLIIFMTDHGSNAILGDGNATFHFEADNSRITEFEFYDLVKEINVVRMMINIDCCFSGNFLNQNNNIGGSWYDLPNALFVSASSNVFSWYWINNVNGDGWAGSWFFHVFWESLDQGQTIINAFNSANIFIPFNQFQPLAVSQIPLLHDNLGINNTWSFSSDPSL